MDTGSGLFSLCARRIGAAVVSFRVRSLTGAVDGDLDHVRVAPRGGVPEGAPQGRDGRRGVGGGGRDGRVDGLGPDERLVALHVDHQRAVERLGDLGEAVGARLVIGPGHADPASERGHRPRDPVVVGRHEDGVDRAGVRRVPIDVLDQGAPADVRQRLARQPGRRMAGGNDGDGPSGGGVAGGRSRGGTHGESYHVRPCAAPQGRRAPAGRLLPTRRSTALSEAVR